MDYEGVSQETDCISRVMIEPTQACRHNPSHHAQRVQDSEARHGVAESWAGVRRPDSSPESALLWVSFCPSVQWGFGLHHL